MSLLKKRHLTLALHPILHTHFWNVYFGQKQNGKNPCSMHILWLTSLIQQCRNAFSFKITPTLQNDTISHTLWYIHVLHSILINNSNSRGDIPPFKLVAKVNLRKTYMVYDFSISFFPLYTTYFLGFFIKSVSQDIWRICEVSETWEWRMV